MTTDSPHILLVEDNPDDIELTLHVLKSQKIANHVTVARDGQEALDLLATSAVSYTMILLDIKLPKLNGIEVLRRLKENPETEKIPVVVLTTSSHDTDIDTCYRLGANSYIVKPVDFRQFSSAVAKIGCYWLLLNQPPS